MAKVFLSPERRPKPHGKYWGMDIYEHDVCCEIADLLKPMLEHNGFIVFIAPMQWSMGQRAAYANANGFDYYMCIHTNASGNGKAEGTATGAECLYYNDRARASIKANQLVYNELTKLYPSKRGIKDYSKFAENNLTKMVSCYPEIAFHDNGRDARWIVDNKAEIAVALCRGICGYFAVKYSETSPAPTQPDNSARIAELTAENKHLREELAKTEQLRRAAVQNLSDMSAKIIEDINKYTL